MASPASASPALELPLDTSRAATGKVALAVPAIAAPAVPYYATLVAAFAAQLARYNGQASIPITASRSAAPAR